MQNIPPAAILVPIALHIGAREDELDELYERLRLEKMPETPSTILAQVRAALAAIRGEAT